MKKKDGICLTDEQIEKLAVEIREFLLSHGIWQDTEIYFNGKRFTTRNPEDGHYYYNDRDKLFAEENQNPKDYFEYVANDHILSMAFEGPVYHMINGFGHKGLIKRFNKIFERYGVYYEQGHAWNLTCYYI